MANEENNSDIEKSRAAELAKRQNNYKKAGAIGGAAALGSVYAAKGAAQYGLKRGQQGARTGAKALGWIPYVGAAGGAFLGGAAGALEGTVEGGTRKGVKGAYKGYKKGGELGRKAGEARNVVSRFTQPAIFDPTNFNPLSFSQTTLKTAGKTGFKLGQALTSLLILLAPVLLPLFILFLPMLLAIVIILAISQSTFT